MPCYAPLHILKALLWRRKLKPKDDMYIPKKKGKNEARAWNVVLTKCAIYVPSAGSFCTQSDRWLSVSVFRFQRNVLFLGCFVRIVGMDMDMVAFISRNLKV